MKSVAVKHYQTCLKIIVTVTQLTKVWGIWSTTETKQSELLLASLTVLLTIYTVCILFGIKGFFELLFFSFVKSILEKLPPWTT